MLVRQSCTPIKKDSMPTKKKLTTEPKQKKILSVDERADIKMRYDAGESPSIIADEYQIEPDSVRVIAHKLGSQSTGPKQNISVDLENEMIRMYVEQHKSATAIGFALGVTHRTVIKHLDKHNLRGK
jgi:hypothetical protein